MNSLIRVHIHAHAAKEIKNESFSANSEKRAEPMGASSSENESTRTGNMQSWL